MPFLLSPFVGQKVTVETATGLVEGVLFSISQTEIIVVPQGKPQETHSLKNLKRVRYGFPEFYDAIRHLARAGEARHCNDCYLALLYSVELLAINFSSQAFAARADTIRRGVISFLEKDFPSAGYSLLPQIEGIISQVLHEDGLQRRTKAFPVWTKEHPDSEIHGKACTNVVQAIDGADSAGDLSRLKHVKKWLTKLIPSIHRLRNNLLHGTMLNVSEHEAAAVILLIQAVHHGVDGHA